MTGSQQNTTGCLLHADEIACTRGTQETILTDDQLLHAVRSTDLRNFLDDLGVVIPAVTTDNEERTLSTLGNRQENARDERLGVVRLLEDGDLLPET